MILFFDTETTGLPDKTAKGFFDPWFERKETGLEETQKWPRLVQIAWKAFDKNGNELNKSSLLVKPDGFLIPQEATNIHGIKSENALKEGLPLDWALIDFIDLIQQATTIVSHNLLFDLNIVMAECIRTRRTFLLSGKQLYCTLELGKDFCLIPGAQGFKWPTLTDLYYKLFGESFTSAHNASSDVEALCKCFWELLSKGAICFSLNTLADESIYTIPGRTFMTHARFTQEYCFGRLNGTYKQYYKNGCNLFCVGRKINGKKESSWKWYHPNGLLFYSGQYYNNEVYGEWKFYHDNGELAAIGNLMHPVVDAYNHESDCDYTYTIEYRDYSSGVFIIGRQAISIGNACKVGEWKFYNSYGEKIDVFTIKDGQYVGYREASTTNVDKIRQRYDDESHELIFEEKFDENGLVERSYFKDSKPIGEHYRRLKDGREELRNYNDTEIMYTRYFPNSTSICETGKLKQDLDGSWYHYSDREDDLLF